MKFSKKIWVLFLCVTLGALLLSLTRKGPVTPPKPPALTPVQLLGKKLFFDQSFSYPPGQSCASCHAPSRAFSDPRSTPVSPGAQPPKFGIRNAPSVAYTAFVPPLHYDTAEQSYEGGFFWDGRVNTLAEQAKGPMFNPIEMNNPNKTKVVNDLKKAAYIKLFEDVYGTAALRDTNQAFNDICLALQQFEKSSEVSPFTSKFDYYKRGQAQLTASEMRGLQLFNDSTKGNCASCHPSTADETSNVILFTDFTYDNLGVPFNDELAKLNPQYEKDKGLGTFLKKPSENGKFKVPTLRNIDITGPYFHNGIFKTLDEVMHFYNERDLGKFGPPEVPENVNKKELGNLKLTQDEMNDIIAFMGTLTDGYDPATGKIAQ